MKNLIKLIPSETKNWLKTFYLFLISTIVGIVGDAIMQTINSGSYSLSAIHWKEIGAAILLAVISYIQKNVMTKKDTPQ